MSLVALLLAVTISSFTSLNVGTLSLGLALVVGTYIGGLDTATVIKGYPADLFILLAGTTYLFAIAQTNGTLDQVAKFAIRLVRGRPRSCRSRSSSSPSSSRPWVRARSPRRR